MSDETMSADGCLGPLMLLLGATIGLGIGILGCNIQEDSKKSQETSWYQECQNGEATGCRIGFKSVDRPALQSAYSDVYKTKTGKAL